MRRCACMLHAIIIVLRAHRTCREPLALSISAQQQVQTGDARRVIIRHVHAVHVDVVRVIQHKMYDTYEHRRQQQQQQVNTRCALARCFFLDDSPCVCVFECVGIFRRRCEATLLTFVTPCVCCWSCRRSLLARMVKRCAARAMCLRLCRAAPRSSRDQHLTLT